ncbi:MAG: hypothetical protein IPJ06_16825 [Saprospiraceae bacterium]|nr:hypothetical protein [Saprospiraceae bacterium]
MPWVNYEYQVERWNPALAMWDTLAVTMESEFTDEGLTNGKNTVTAFVPLAIMELIICRIR